MKFGMMMARDTLGCDSVHFYHLRSVAVARERVRDMKGLLLKLAMKHSKVVRYVHPAGMTEQAWRSLP